MLVAHAMQGQIREEGGGRWERKIGRERDGRNTDWESDVERKRER